LSTIRGQLKPYSKDGKIYLSDVINEKNVKLFL